jgi:hypothetical protein
MRKPIFLVLSLMFCISSSLSAQVNEWDIQMKKSFWGVEFFQYDQPLKPKQVLSVMQSNHQAYNGFKAAKVNYDIASVFGFIGGFMIGWPIGSALGGGDPKWGLAAGGAGVLLLSIPFGHNFNRQAKNAIDIYNRGVNGSSARKYSLQLTPTRTGAKLVFMF